MKSPRVKCVVNTCTHWMYGNHCTAANIDILNEEVGKMSQYKQQTECKTFAERRGLSNILGSMDNKNWYGFAEELLGVDRRLNPTVTCIVDTCKYWDKGNICAAEAIEVTGRNAKECQQTNCETFEFNQQESMEAQNQQQQKENTAENQELQQN